MFFIGLPEEKRNNAGLRRRYCDRQIIDSMDNRKNQNMIPRALLLTIMAGMILLGGCKPPKLQSEKEPEGTNPFPETVSSPASDGAAPVSAPVSVPEAVVEKQFPLVRVIISADGRSIPGEIVGKRGDEIAFKRKSDGQFFVISFAQLSPNDQLDLAALADESIEAVAALSSDQNAAAATSPAPVNRLKAARKARWFNDPEEAFAESKKIGLPVYVLFTGSDWCPPCKALEKDVHRNFKFSSFADEHLVLLAIDFPKRKAQSAEIKERNRAMAEKWGVRGYPTIFLSNDMDKPSENIPRTGNIDSFLRGIESAISNLPAGG
jgi:thiol-disulfide isomerase/thioredoxin